MNEDSSKKIKPNIQIKQINAEIVQDLREPSV